ncbi:MAG: threonine/serine dehydratase [Pseudomonadota bacterium]
MTSEPAAALPIAFGDVEAAASRLRSERVRTELMVSRALNEAVGARVYVKPECLQRTGSFKFRGAFNRLAMMDDDARARGIVATSSGNHAQGIAEAAHHFCVPATIVMPTDAPELKKTRTRRAGADIVPYDRATDDRFAIAETIVAQSGGTFVSPYDDAGVMAGQGTVGLEIAHDLTALGTVPDAVLVPTSGGGLLSGIATVFRHLVPGAEVMPAEPEGFDDTTRSLVSGARQKNAQKTGSIADALMSEQPGLLTFAVNRTFAKPGFAVSDEAMMAAMAFAARELKLVVEPGGASALAAVLANREIFAGRTVVVVLSGGNVEPSVLAKALALELRGDLPN